MRRSLAARLSRRRISFVTVRVLRVRSAGLGITRSTSTPISRCSPERSARTAVGGASPTLLRARRSCCRQLLFRARPAAARQATDLSVAQAVVAEGQNLAGDRDFGDLASATLRDPFVTPPTSTSTATWSRRPRRPAPACVGSGASRRRRASARVLSAPRPQRCEATEPRRRPRRQEPRPARCGGGE